MNSLKFAMLTTLYPPYHLGGDALHVYHLSNELAKRGHEVHVIHSLDAYYLNRRRPPQGHYPNHQQVVVHTLKSRLGIVAPLICGFVGLSYPLASKALGLISEIKPDVIHHHNIVGFGPAVLGAKAPKVLYTAHDYWLICPRNNLLKPNKTFCYDRRNCIRCSLLWRRPPQLWRRTAALKKRLWNIDTIITPSQYVGRTLQQAGVSRPITDVPNFVLEPEAVGEAIYDFPYFLFVGLLEEHKGILNLTEAFRHVKDEAEVELLIVGTGSLEDKLKRLIAQQGCQDRIKLLGRIDDKGILANLYANAIALVIPSIWPENAPLVALEALACGTPIVVSNQGGLPEIAGKSQPELIFKDEDELRNILITVAANRRGQRSAFKQAYRRFYSPESFMERYSELIARR